MAKKSAVNPDGISLVIVESPAKARTIGKFLGSGYRVEASIGHIRDLPQGAKEIPAEYRGEAWSRLGVNVDHDFDPLYIIPPEKKAQVAKLRELLKGAKDLYLATDEDREGEAISWHLNEVLKPRVPVHRLVFHEITREAINEALANTRSIDADLVRAQETRRILDRLYGYEVSPLLWRKVRPKLSAGRVQSVAVRLIVQRERERMKFVSSSWWDLEASLAKQNGDGQFVATLDSVAGQKIPTGKDFDSATGKLKNDNVCLLDETAANALVERLRGTAFRVVSIEEKPYTQRPAAPFTTSTLQQEANRKLGYTARRTMQVAQSLYENGHITYMRTDSTNLASVAVEAARDLVRSEYGREFLPDQPRVYQSKVKNAQEAHEAIRPAGHPFEMPEVMSGTLSHDEYRLFDMIWKRTIASQMADAKLRRTIITIAADDCLFRVSGSTIEFAGYLKAYIEGSDESATDSMGDNALPAVIEKELLKNLGLVSKGHSTQPPARYSEAALTKALEEMGIGRPSTYASIIDTILAREYVFKKGNALVPTWTAFAVSQLLEGHLANLVDYQFTAQMEEDLDAISRGEANNIDYLSKFYFGRGEPGLKKRLENKVDEIDAREVSRIAIGQPEGQEPIVVRVGRYGPFLEQGERRGAIPDGLAPDELTIEKCLELLSQAKAAEEPLGTCPDTHKAIYLKNGRFGPYVQRGENDDDEKKNASLLKGMSVDQVDLATALKLLQIPRDVGKHPTSGELITAYNGKFGPYIKCGNESRSLPAEMTPLDVTLDQAVQLLAQPKVAKRSFGAKVAAIKTLGPSPVTGQEIELRSGRYGMYVTDGVTNASLPRNSTAEEATLEESVRLLAERAAAGPSKAQLRRGVKKAAKKTAKKTAKTKAASTAETPAVNGAAPKKGAEKAVKKSAKKGAK